LGKIILNVRIYHYGFFLAMPGAVLLVVALCGWLPAWVARRGGDGGAVRAAMLGVLVAVIVPYLLVMRTYVAGKTHRVGRGADVFQADIRGELATKALQELDRRALPGETLVVVPEGVMLNYLSRRANPTPHTNFMPTELVIFGEDAIMDGLRQSPPDWVAFIPKDTSEFGAQYFGADYARRIGEWIAENYEPQTTVSGPDPRDERFKCTLLRRRRASTHGKGAGGAPVHPIADRAPLNPRTSPSRLGTNPHIRMASKP
jgi:uncharacterized membrane protein YeaQ/YmgE (transglycosylase-associated protein family)